MQATTHARLATALRLCAVLCTVFWAAAIARAGDDEPLLRDGDRVVFYGDSITQQQRYTRYVQQVVLTRHPALDVRFFNAGWSGDTAKGGGDRLMRDVLALEPTVVTLCFGMNDGRYRRPDERITTEFTESLDSIVERLTTAGARVLVLSPGCVDPDQRPPLGATDYNATLAGLADAARGVAKRRRCRFVDLRTEMLRVQTERKAADPQFTMIPDGVHPSPAGHLVMAHAILRGLGVPPAVPLGEIDVRRGEGKGLRAIANEPGRVLLETAAPAALPLWIESGSVDVAGASGFADYAGSELTVRGLAAGVWDVRVSGATAGRFAAADLAKGVHLLSSGDGRPRLLHDVIERKEALFFDAWREVRLPFETAIGIGAAWDALLAADAAMADVARRQAAPDGPVRIELEMLPSGPNLAAGKPYETSDPNGRGWGDGGLTDGSWVGDARHCFATGTARDFPKTVTVDLGKAQKLAAVRLGVPAFGSTRTVNVEVSRDGRAFREVATHAFGQRAEERVTLRFDPVTARHVRLVYVDHHEESVDYTPTFCFTTELEAFGP